MSCTDNYRIICNESFKSCLAMTILRFHYVGGGGGGLYYFVTPIYHGLYTRTI